MKGNRFKKKTVKIKIDTIQCDFCGFISDNVKPYGEVPKLWASIQAETKCGCLNNWHICPGCLSTRIPEIHKFLNKED